ncbi:M14-type cytosolic carboxypeptidase [Erythrobacter ramosus]
MGISLRYLWAGLAMTLGACAQTPPPASLAAANSACRTDSVMLAFDFDGASPARCAVMGERAFTLLITPEHAPPINPSSWYAFRYEADGTAPVSVTLRYLGGAHRYAPKWQSGDATRDLPVTVSADGTAASMDLPAGEAIVAAQELITPADTSADLLRWSKMLGTPPFTLGSSLDGRAIEAIRIGRTDAPRLVILLGRQHPPEVTGAMAMQAFVETLVGTAARGGLGDVQFLVVPMLNPDGTARGHWRANRGAVDLNRDWGDFSQPETRSVKVWLDALPAGVRPALMVDFHSTGRNLFYVQGDEASPAQQRFLTAWLGGREQAFAGYPFTIEPRNANPGSGTAKNWFHARYAIPAYTYEVADTADRSATRAAASDLAEGLLGALATLEH